MSLSTIVTNREYKRCKTECSAPPIYIVTGSHFLAMRLSKGLSLTSVDKYLKKYQALSRNTSVTSVSRRAGPSQFGHVVSTNDLIFASGEVPSPLGFQSFTSGRSTGRSLSGTGCQSHFSQ